ncbi:uroporphyrinogen-III synthase [Hyphococcus lacteus]|uniref:Uroporphyrinogen-III synthase n=1 Tax=Hyphococcus lacteus TaxID=3143536 RepID=A0ABV3Z3T1_9PROT
MRVLVTRAEPDGERFAALCRAKGLTPILSPVMEIQITRQDIDLRGIGALAFTSVNGVRAFEANCDVRDLPVFAVGPVTGDAARAAGFISVRDAEGDVHRLHDCIVSERGQFSDAVLHVAGADRAGDLVRMLKSDKISARRMTLYDAKAVSALTDETVNALRASPPVEWASFFSPRTAKLFMELAVQVGVVDQLKNTRVACLSDAVAERAGSANWHSLHVAPEYSAQSLLELIVQKNAGCA